MGAEPRSRVPVTGGAGVTGRRLVAAIPVENVPAKPGEMPAVIADTTAARALGYQPAHDLKSGLATVWPEFEPSVALEGKAAQ